MMPRRSPPCHPKLHAMLESYFSGASIKSSSEITGRSSTDPTALKRIDVNAELSKLMRNLADDEVAELGGFYRETGTAEVALRRATMHRKRRKFKTAMAEVTRAYNDAKKRP
jgi:hypothetical protein